MDSKIISFPWTRHLDIPRGRINYEIFTSFPCDEKTTSPFPQEMDMNNFVRTTTTVSIYVRTYAVCMYICKRRYMYMYISGYMCMQSPCVYTWQVGWRSKGLGNYNAKKKLKIDSDSKTYVLNIKKQLDKSNYDVMQVRPRGLS